MTTSEIYQPLDFNVIVNDHEYFNALYQLRKIFNSRLIYLSETEEKINELINILDKKISRLN